MKAIAAILILIVVLLHVAFFALETIFWSQPSELVEKIIKDLEFPVGDKNVERIAANQGVYNLFLAVGLLWALVDRRDAFRLRVFFLLCVIVAGIVGWHFIGKATFLWMQTVPA